MDLFLELLCCGLRPPLLSVAHDVAHVTHLTSPPLSRMAQQGKVPLVVAPLRIGILHEILLTSAWRDLHDMPGGRGWGLRYGTVRTYARICIRTELHRKLSRAKG